MQFASREPESWHDRSTSAWSSGHCETSLTHTHTHGMLPQALPSIAVMLIGIIWQIYDCHSITEVNFSVLRLLIQIEANYFSFLFCFVFSTQFPSTVTLFPSVRKLPYSLSVKICGLMSQPAARNTSSGQPQRTKSDWQLGKNHWHHQPRQGHGKSYWKVVLQLLLLVT